MTQQATSTQNTLPLAERPRPTLGNLLDEQGSLHSALHRLIDGELDSLWLTGSSGSGKTHALMATIHAWQQRHTASAAYLTLPNNSELAVHLLDAQPAEGLLAIDHIDRIIGHKTAETALFHLHNRQQDQGGTLLYASQTRFALDAFALPDLASRLRQTTHSAMPELNDDARLLLLQQHNQAMGFNIKDKVLHSMLRRGGRDLHNLKQLMESLAHRAHQLKKVPSIVMLSDVLQAQQRPQAEPESDGT